MMQSNILFPHQGKDFLLFLLLFVALTILTISSLGMYTGIFVHMNSRIETLKEPTHNFIKDMPGKFLVPWEALTPAKDQGHRMTCWAFAVTGFLEASYNYVAKKLHGHSHTSYVSFSEQVFGIKMVERCTFNSSNKYCTNGQRLHNASDGIPEWLYYFKDVNHKWAVPNNLCEYKSYESEWDVCPHINTTLKENPVRFTVENITTAYTIRGIKELLVNTNLPVTWTHGTFTKVYKTACSRLSNPNLNTDCVTKKYPCGNDYCYEIKVSAFDKNGVFDMTEKSYVSGTHSMLIVGWNDHMRINRDSPYLGLNEFSKGGFIVKNSWGFSGHSAGYWASNHSTIQEDSLCPNFGVYQNWIPVNYECLKTNFNLSACANNLYRTVHDQLYSDATVLKCSDLAKKEEYANALGLTQCALPQNKGKELRFALQSEVISQQIYTSAPQVKIRYQNEDSGQAQFYLVMWEEGSNDIIEVITDVTTYIALERLLEPVVTVENSKYCGYYFVPFDTFLFGNNRYLNYGDDTIAFSSFNIKWDKTSFLDEKNGGYNYEALEKEVKHNQYIPLNFKGPYSD
ncbi:Papain family cysteine protease domain containing protein [Entamoeba marina]